MPYSRHVKPGMSQILLQLLGQETNLPGSALRRHLRNRMMARTRLPQLHRHDRHLKQRKTKGVRLPGRKHRVAAWWRRYITILRALHSRSIYNNRRTPSSDAVRELLLRTQVCYTIRNPHTHRKQSLRRATVQYLHVQRHPRLGVPRKLPGARHPCMLCEARYKDVRKDSGLSGSGNASRQVTHLASVEKTIWGLPATSVDFSLQGRKKSYECGMCGMWLLVR